MNIGFKSNKLKKQLSSASEIKRHFGSNAKRVASRLADMEAADNLAILTQIPASNCHSLSGDRKGQWAVNISPNHRLIFEIMSHPIPMIRVNEIDLKLVDSIRLLKVEDYH
tara:strand:+ start:153 stop:485 length:333 start_codon:yes stop_codon:yes gene_type:complete